VPLPPAKFIWAFHSHHERLIVGGLIQESSELISVFGLSDFDLWDKVSKIGSLLRDDTIELGSVDLMI
jgi:hypothetical protein